MRFEVGLASDIPPGARKIVYPTPRLGVGVFNVAGRFYALKNTCPHQGAQLCRGALTGTSVTRVTPDGRYEVEWVREGEILSCPWHHWQFDIASGRTVFPSRDRVATYEVTLDDRAAVPSGVETYPVVVEEQMLYLELGHLP